MVVACLGGRGELVVFGPRQPLTSCRLCKPLMSGWLLVRGGRACLPRVAPRALRSSSLAGAGISGSLGFGLWRFNYLLLRAQKITSTKLRRRSSDPRPSTQRVVVIDAPPADATAAAAPRPVGPLDVQYRRAPAVDGAPEYVVRGELLRSSTSEPDAIDRRGKSKRLRDAEPARC